MGAFILDGEELAFGLADKNVVSVYPERLAPAIGNFRCIGQIDSVAVVQAGKSRKS
jgi:hypothetical protein